MSTLVEDVLAARLEQRVVVLVVDDDPDHRALVGLRLRAAGFEVREVATGEDALDALEGVDLVLCDYRLPGMDGLSVVATIRDRGGPAVILSTGMGSEVVAGEALRAGAVDYLVKDASYLRGLPPAVERAWRHSDLERRAAELQRLALLVTSAADAARACEEIVRGARRLLRAQAAVLFVRRDGQLVAEALDGEAVADQAGLASRCAAVLGDVALADAALVPPPVVAGGGRDLLVPLPGESGAVGVLAVLGARGSGDARGELGLAEAFGAFAGIALVNLQRLELERRLVAHLEELNAMRRDFLASVSHELRTPLTCIVGFAETMRRRWDDLQEAERHEFLDQIRRHSDELEGLVARLLDIAVAEAGGLACAPRPMPLHTQVEATVAMLAPLLAGREVTVDVVPLVVDADPSLLGRALTNLLSNAVKFSPPGSPVRVVVEREGGMASVEVIDRGVGMSPEDVGRAFDPFWRSNDAVRNATRGVGVGLALVREYVRVMGGQVDVRSELGRGSAFTLRLPLHTAEAT